MAAVIVKLLSLNSQATLSVLNLDENGLISGDAWYGLALALALNPVVVRTLSLQQNGLGDDVS